jgi:hypothetical protein
LGKIQSHDDDTENGEGIVMLDISAAKAIARAARFASSFEATSGPAGYRDTRKEPPFLSDKHGSESSVTGCSGDHAAQRVLERNFKMTRRSERRARRIADRTNDVVADGTVIRVPLMMMDAALRDDLHRRYPPATDDATSTAAVVAVTEFVMQRDAAAADVYHFNRPGFRFGDAAGHVRAQESYEAGVRELCDAWRAKDGVDVTKAGTAAAQIKPVGAWSKGIGMKAGDSCSFDGKKGVLVDAGDYLVCQTQPETAPRVPATNPSSADAQPGTRAHVDAVWRQMCDELTNAWKS